MSRQTEPPHPPRFWLAWILAACLLLLLALPSICILYADAAEQSIPTPETSTIKVQILRMPMLVARKWQRSAEVPEFETDENALIEAALLARAHVIRNCTVTHYDPCAACCGKSDGITASGLQATPYVSVAVDPAIIPLDADVLADYGDGILHYYRADDTGLGVEGNHIDLCVSSHEEAVALGVRTATVYWITQEELP